MNIGLSENEKLFVNNQEVAMKSDMDSADQANAQAAAAAMQAVADEATARNSALTTEASARSQAIASHANASNAHPQYQLKTKIFDYSVNQAKISRNHEGWLILGTDKKNTGQVAGNFQGAGVGNKPIAGLAGFDGLPISQLPHILAQVQLLSRPTATDADERQDGLAFNVLIDLQGNGNTADFKVISICNTLNGCTDEYGQFGQAASITDFDINAFEVLTTARTSGGAPAAYAGGEKAPFLKNHFYVINGISSYVTGTNYRTSTVVDNVWTGIPMNLDMLLNGGTMPMTGAQFSVGYPNCKIVSALSFDNGHPARAKLPGILAQIGDSSLALHSVTAVTSLTLNGVNYLE